MLTDVRQNTYPFFFLNIVCFVLEEVLFWIGIEICNFWILISDYLVSSYFSQADLWKCVFALGITHCLFFAILWYPGANCQLE